MVVEGQSAGRVEPEGTNFDGFLRLAEYRILMGMRFLMDDGPHLAVDEVGARAHVPLQD